LPFFKPGWSPDMLTSGNYVCHFLVVRRELLEQVGRIREGYDGAQDYDLVLRLWECTPRFRHIPQVLYHWRDTPLSTAVHVTNKPAAGSAGSRALAEHLARCQVTAEVSSPAPTQYHVKYSALGAPRVALVTAPQGSAAAWAQRFGSCRDVATELVVIADAPTAGAQWVKWEGARDLGEMYRRAIAEHPADLYVFLDADLEPTDVNAIKELVAQAARPEIGVAGAKLLYPDTSIRHAGLWATDAGCFVRPFQHMADDGDWTTMGNANFARNFVAVGGACFAARADVIAKAGGLRGGSEPELELCAQVRGLGLRIVCSPFARFTHPGLDFEEPSGRLLPADPFFNPNLDPTCTNGGVRPR
jgi:O-antigen biosynthesis protein